MRLPKIIIDDKLCSHAVCMMVALVDDLAFLKKHLRWQAKKHIHVLLVKNVEFMQESSRELRIFGFKL